MTVPSALILRTGRLEQPRVDTKLRSNTTFGNDSTAVDTKGRAGETFGNDTVGFVRVRKRQIKGGHPDMRDYRANNGTLATTSASFDLVRAVRVDGKPRHQFVLGLGSQKDVERNGYGWFWSRAIHRMTKHGLTESQRQHLIAEMVRKGARPPTIAHGQAHASNWPNHRIAMDEILAWLQSEMAP